MYTYLHTHTCPSYVHFPRTPCGNNPIANQCKCVNGVAKTGAACTINGASMCSSCSKGYTKNVAGTACTGTNRYPNASHTPNPHPNRVHDSPFCTKLE